ncbi:MAG: response regulator, partial [Burkholderiales bacterium]
MLAVDDHQTNLEILGHYLRGWGVRYTCVTRPAEALARLRQAAAAGQPFAVAILDMQMLDMDGLALARAIREASGLPVMGVGMLFDPAQVNAAVARGDCDFAAIARGMLSDPHWAWRAAAALDGEVGYPPQYVRGYKSGWLRGMRS